MGLLDYLIPRIGQAKNESEAQQLALQQARNTAQNTTEDQQKLSDLIANPVAEQSVRREINLPVGPMTQPQQDISNAASMASSGINPSFRNMSVRQAKEIAPFMTAEAAQTKVETPKKSYFVNLKDKNDVTDTYKPGYVPLEHYNQIHPSSENTAGDREEAQQDKLEEQARSHIAGIRGDASLKSVETQRDAAITAFNRIKKLRDSGEGLNPIDYVDILGQIYKARTGSAPTETVLNEARQQTAGGNFNKAYTFFTGNQAPATSQDIMNSLQEMSLHMGQQADQLHDSYMGPHMDMPTSLKPERAERLRKLARGLSFAEATHTGTTQPQPKIGDVLDGHRYKGGNPSDPSSWIQIQQGQP